MYIGLSRLSALQENMNMIANNIANINTTGFKANKIVFAEYLDKPKGMKETLSMVEDYGNFRVKDSGPIKSTGNPLDVALQGTGYFGIQGPGGQTYYSRAGAFAISPEGVVVTQQGYPVLDNGGSTITIPPTAKNILIDQQGQITSDEGQIGALMVQDFENIQKLKPVGNSLYSTDETGTPATTTKVIQGSLEGSNVQGVVEMTDMIEVSRAYQSVQKMLQNEHDRVRATIRAMTQAS